MTITLPLQPYEEAKLIAIACAKGLSTDALVREALDRILAEAVINIADGGPFGAATGAVLIAAMQSSPYPEIELVAAGERLPVRDFVL